MKVKFFSFIGLLISFGLLFIALPLARHYELPSILLLLSFTAIIFFSVYALAENKIYFVVAVFLAIPSIIIYWFKAFDNSYSAQISDLVSSILLYSYVSFVILKYIFHKKEVSVNVVFGAACVYMLLGYVWAHAFTLLELTSPNSFIGLADIPANLSVGDRVDYLLQSLFFYSYISLTTLGYGNISPATVAASSISSAEAVIGQLYITILIARFVGLHISQHID